MSIILNSSDMRSESAMFRKKKEGKEVDFTILSGKCIERCPECGRNGRLKMLCNGDRKYTHKGIIGINTLRITDYCHIKKV